MTWNPSTFRDLVVLFQTQPPALLFLLFWALGAVSGFLVFMPLVGNVVATLWLGMIGEQVVTRARGKQSGTEMEQEA